MTELGKDLVSYLGKSFYSPDSYFKGYFDNIKVYNRALSELEIAKGQGVSIPALKGATADGYQIVTSKIEKENHILNLCFSRSNSANSNLENVQLTLDMVSGCTLKTDITKGIDLSGTGTSVEILVPGEDKEQIWTIKGSLCGNPVIAGEYADPDINIFGDTYYIYPTTDGYSGWSGTEFHVFSSKDLVNWSDQGVILDVSKDVEWSVGSAWAPTAEEKNGTYYFYFCAKNSSGTSCIGVATSKNPTGPFVAESEPLLTPGICSKINMGQTIDPYVFTDDDGTSYLLFGNGNPAIVELNDDMVSIKKDTMQNLSGLNNFRESVVVIKRNGTYHFTWSCDDTGSENYHVNYGTSDSIYGPVTNQYAVLQKDNANDILGTGHQSMIQIPGKDEYYMAYHRFYTPLNVYTSGLGYHRETCIDKVTFDAETGLMNVMTPTLDGVEEVKLSSDTKPDLKPEISPENEVFDKNTKSSNYKDIEVDVTLNGNTLTGIKNGEDELKENTDYTRTSTTTKTTVTILKSYLEKQETKTSDISFIFDDGTVEIIKIQILKTASSDEGEYDSGSSGVVKEEKKVDVSIGDSTDDTATVKVKVTNTKDASGVSTDTVELGKSEAQKIVKTILSKNKNNLIIDLSSLSKDQARDQIKVVLSKDVTEVFRQNKIEVQVKLPQISLVISASSIAETSTDGVNFLVKELTDEEQIKDSKVVLKQISKGASLLSVPVDVNAKDSLKTQIIIPILENIIPENKSKRKDFVQSLAVLVQHSDGENRLQKGTIVYDSTGKPVSIAIEVEKFSSFSLVKTKWNEKIVKYKNKKSVNKIVTSKFNKNIDVSTVTEDSVYVLDSKGNKVDVTVSVKGKKIVITPVKKYKAGKTYSAYVTKNVCYTNGKAIAKAKKYVFAVKK
ncbi:MAG: family 43 glycosylhydrolase, partial [Velocimicrobium sp.]